MHIVANGRVVRGSYADDLATWDPATRDSGRFFRGLVFRFGTRKLHEGFTKDPSVEGSQRIEVSGACP
jgi:hypothetical protein